MSNYSICMPGWDRRLQPQSTIIIRPLLNGKPPQAHACVPFSKQTAVRVGGQYRLLFCGCRVFHPQKTLRPGGTSRTHFTAKPWPGPISPAKTWDTPEAHPAGSVPQAPASHRSPASCHGCATTGSLQFCAGLWYNRPGDRNALEQSKPVTGQTTCRQCHERHRCLAAYERKG